MNSSIKRDIIIDHYQNPVNKGLKNDASYEHNNTNNDSCIDNIDMMLKIDNGIIKDICFDGEACAISTSATSIMINTLIGKKKKDALNILNNYEAMINEKEYDKNILGELIVYDEIYKQPNRKNCALLPYKAIKAMIKSSEEK